MSRLLFISLVCLRWYVSQEIREEKNFHIDTEGILLGVSNLLNANQTKYSSQTKYMNLDIAYQR